ncbi:MAG: epoxyqueuosine reductase QueH [Deltaproteobacteria bacterium]|nr:epoxyqueuosine reductase QueH [Deltaproteobacteria bacterium]MBI5886256.1 epoxyqueuosine reductase QueH [Deltaproteobacteria bacterium]
MLYNEEYKAIEFIREMKASLGNDARVSNGELETAGGVKRPTGSGQRTPEIIKFPAHGERCVYCYSVRLEATAKAAKEAGFDAFTSSLLYSRYQAHDEIRRAGTGIGERLGVPFYYADFRGGWQAGIDESRAMGLYRQKYCGCIYSRIERYAKKGGM